jgi:hypothetical protein
MIVNTLIQIKLLMFLSKITITPVSSEANRSKISIQTNFNSSQESLSMKPNFRTNTKSARIYCIRPHLLPRTEVEIK